MSIATCLSFYDDIYSTAQCCQYTQVNGQGCICRCSHKLIISRAEHVLIQHLVVRKGIAIVCQESHGEGDRLDMMMNTCAHPRSVLRLQSTNVLAAQYSLAMAVINLCQFKQLYKGSNFVMTALRYICCIKNTICCTLMPDQA